MIYSHDKTAQAGYLKFSDEMVKKTIPVSDTINCDLDEQGMLCGIEVLNIGKEALLQWSKSLKKSEFIFS